MRPAAAAWVVRNGHLIDWLGRILCAQPLGVLQQTTYRAGAGAESGQVVPDKGVKGGRTNKHRSAITHRAKARESASGSDGAGGGLQRGCGAEGHRGDPLLRLCNRSN
jgi:hypothetical protein